MSSKKSGTSRPLVRCNPRDVLLYQALVDRLGPDIERALPPRDVVFAYRQTLDTSQADSFSGTPRRQAYQEQIESILLFQPEIVYSIATDIAGFFLHVNVDELERLLFTISEQSAVVRDLADLLRTWQVLGVRGLPQGLRPSSPLGNVFLMPIDRLLLDRGVPYVRWMDDFVIATEGFHAARRIQDEIERELYDLGLTLASDKTKIQRWDAALEEREDAQAELERLKRARKVAAEKLRAEMLTWAIYPGTEVEPIDPEELDRDTVVEEYDSLLAALHETHLPSRFQSRARATLRELSALKLPHELARVPELLIRAPDLTPDALGYVATVASRDRPAAFSVFEQLLDADRFIRDFEKLTLSHAALALPRPAPVSVSAGLARWALEDQHPLVRARALLAWGALSHETDFHAADLFWARASPPWQPYALVAIQKKEADSRNKRFAEWGSSGRFMGRLAALLKRSGIGWRKL